MSGERIGSIGKRGRKWVVGILATDATGRRVWRDWPWQYPTRREAQIAFHRIPASRWDERKVGGDA